MDALRRSRLVFVKNLYSEKRSRGFRIRASSGSFSLLSIPRRSLPGEISPPSPGMTTVRESLTGEEVHYFSGSRKSLPGSRPILLYDNDCGICSTFARLATRTSKGWIETVGLFTERGRRVKSSFFSPGDNPDEMFWLLAGNTGYGGRSGFLPLVREIVRGRVL